MMKMLKLLLVLMTVFFIVFVGCAKKNTALDPKAIDLNISPGENFYQYANGTWMKNTPIPDDQNSWGAFQILRDNNLSQLRTILDGAIAAKDAAPGSITQKIRDFYTAGMDTAQIEKDGIALLKNEFDKIASIKSIEDLQNTIAYFHTIGISSIFRTYGYADQENSEMVICQIGMGGLGLPDRDYYTEEQFKGLLEQYKQHVVKMFILVGETEETAKNIAERVVSFETRLAQAVMTRLERRDPYKTYNKMGIYKLQKLSPNWNWNKYFVNVDIKKHGDINIRLPEFLKEISKMVHDVSLDNWKLYLRWKVLDETASYLNSAIEKQNFEFFGKTLYGSKKMQPRWKSVLRTTNSALGEAVGQRYVEKYFPPAAKDHMLRLVGNLKTTLGERIQQLEWMGSETKEKALVKLEAMGLKIGYPDKWKDYSALEVKDDSYVLNVLRSNKFDVRFNWDKIGKPVEKLEWGMNPQRVNAGYSTAKNEIIFPAGILQPPFFSFDADDAVNYGAIGCVIGHEMTHGFDDGGRQYDADGNLNDWWTEKDAENYKARTKLIVDQYNVFTVLDSLHVDGELTLGENIADIGGLRIAFESLKKAFEQNGKAGKIDGFTQEQRFFLTLAQVWRRNVRDKSLERQLKLDVHSPGRFRVNGPVSNMPEFYEAFDVKEGDALYKKPEERAAIW